MIQRNDSVKESLKIADLIIGIVRGETPVDAVRNIGVELEQENGFYKLKSGNFETPVTPTASDLASGILTYSSGKKRDFRKWAFFVLGESGAIDFSLLESHPQGEQLISALWDASFEGRISGDTLELARQLAENKSR